MNLAQRVSDFLAKNYISAGAKILVGVSTGIDSMVLLHILQTIKQPVVVAHVNHGMRETSQNEAVFLAEYCNNLQIKLEILKLDPETEMPDGSNFQAWAREKRYQFFAEVANQNECDYLATAHHLGDKFETFFMHALRGSGITGLASLPAFSGQIVRPLAEITRTEIETYAAENELAWHEDASNSTLDYTRNKVRHLLLPQLPEIEPRFEKGLANTLQNLQQEQTLLAFFVADWKTKNCHDADNNWHINLAALQQVPNPESLLWHLFATVDSHLPAHEIAHCFTASVGSMYLGKTHQALRDRDTLVISKIENENYKPVRISASTSKITEPLFIEFEVKSIEDMGVSSLLKNLQKNTECFDFDKLAFPLELRKWREGDRFKPLGMTGFKKVSDFLINQKMNRFAKHNVNVLTSNGEIVWLVGHRIDERFKIVPTSRKAYLAKLKK